MSYPQELAVMGWEGALKMWEMWKDRGDGERIESGGEVVIRVLGRKELETGRPWIH